MKLTVPYWFCVTAVTAALASMVSASEIWGGSSTSFTLASGSDPTLAVNQDRLTPNVWLTRGPNMGLYNARLETNYSHFSSPTNTEWAYGDLVNYAWLHYTNWEGWNGKNPPSMVGQNAVVHLIADDIYLSVKFISWGSGSSGGFSYVRSTPGALQPAAPQLGRCTLAGPALQFEFTNAPGFTFTVLGSTNVTLPLADWSVLGTVTDAPAGSGFYRFTDEGAITNAERRCYRVRWP